MKARFIFVGLAFVLALSGCSLALPDGRRVVVSVRVAIEAPDAQMPSPTPTATMPPVTAQVTPMPGGRAIRVTAGQSIQAALDRATPGDTVEVGPGRYRGSIRIETDGVKLRAVGAVTIEGTTWYTVYIRARGATLDGFTITGAKSHGVFITGSERCLITNCDISGSGWAGVQLGGDNGSASYNTVQGCEIHHNRVEGIYIRGTDSEHKGRHIPMVGNTLDGNYIHDNGGEGIQNTATFGPPAPEGTIISNNRIINNGGDWGGGMCLEGNNLTVTDNYVDGNGGTGPGGIYLANASSGTIRNNDVRNCRGQGAQGIVLYQCSGVQLSGNTLNQVAMGG